MYNQWFIKKIGKKNIKCIHKIGNMLLLVMLLSTCCLACNEKEYEIYKINVDVGDKYKSVDGDDDIEAILEFVEKVKGDECPARLPLGGEKYILIKVVGLKEQLIKIYDDHIEISGEWYNVDSDAVERFKELYGELEYEELDYEEITENKG